MILTDSESNLLEKLENNETNLKRIINVFDNIDIRFFDNCDFVADAFSFLLDELKKYDLILDTSIEKKIISLTLNYLLAINEISAWNIQSPIEDTVLGLTTIIQKHNK